MRLTSYFIKRICKQPLSFNSIAVTCLAALFTLSSSTAIAGPPSHAQGKPPPQSQMDKQPLIIKEQGSFAVGGTFFTAPGTHDPLNPTLPDGQTFHGDHAYVQFQIPPNARELPMVMWHGGGQMAKTWESTPDGRDGYQNIFLRRGFSTYIIDQPRRGRAGRSTEETTITPTPSEQNLFTVFRLGVWPEYFPGVQFPHVNSTVTLPVEEPLNQYFRQVTPNTGPGDNEVVSDAVAALFDKIGPAILLTHSASGAPGWITALKSPNVKAIVTYEPVAFTFPEGEAPPALPTAYDGSLLSPGTEIPLSEFLKLTEIPIQVIFGDFVPSEPSLLPGPERWRLRLIYAQQFVDTINSHGGDAELLHLPEIGVFGNTHFPFSDLNNLEIADLLSQYLNEKGLDKRGNGGHKHKSHDRRIKRGNDHHDNMRMILKKLKKHVSHIR